MVEKRIFATDEELESGDWLELAIAAKTAGVSTKTVLRYAEMGRLAWRSHPKKKSRGGFFCKLFDRSQCEAIADRKANRKQKAKVERTGDRVASAQEWLAAFDRYSIAIAAAESAKAALGSMVVPEACWQFAPDFCKLAGQNNGQVAGQLAGQNKKSSRSIRISKFRVEKRFNVIADDDLDKFVGQTIWLARSMFGELFQFDEVVLLAFDAEDSIAMVQFGDRVEELIGEYRFAVAID